MTPASLLSDFFALFFPNFCFGCHDALKKGEEILCSQCLSELPRLDYFQSDNNPLVNRFIGRVPMKHGWALLKFQKAGIVQNLLHQLKYKNRPEIGERLGKILAQKIKEANQAGEIDLIIPVPLHKNRIRMRGYNQSSMIARGISEVFEVPHSEMVIKRVSATKTQTKKSKVERWENVNYAFQVIDVGAISTKRILIVDDVVTTGATIEAIAKCLLNAGAREISVACLAEVL